MIYIKSSALMSDVRAASGADKSDAEAAVSRPRPSSRSQSHAADGVRLRARHLANGRQRPAQPRSACHRGAVARYKTRSRADLRGESER